MEEYITTLDIYPNLESNKIEFKTNLVPGDKLMPTICGFLNSGGGHIICGIDDTTRQIKGIDKTSKHIDTFLLNIDTIYHLRKIITEKQEALHPNTITTQICKQKQDKIVIIITIKPDINTKYQVSDGNIYYRVNASNYRINSSRMYTEYEVQSKMSHIKTHVLKDCRNLINCLQNQIIKMENKVIEIKSENSNLEKLLFSRILNEKEYVESKTTNSYYECFYKCFNFF